MSVTHPSSTWALVPLKSGEHAKSRLASVLSAPQRSRLFFAMAQRVLQALRDCSGIEKVFVATASPRVASFAAQLGACPILQSTEIGMSFALSSALRRDEFSQPRRVLMLPGDLPLISPAALTEILETSESGIVVVPDRQRIGTNALLCSPPRALTPDFGGHSFDRHLARAAAAGVKATVLESPALSLDLDCPADLDILRCSDAAQLLDVLDAEETSIALTE
ncbi:2-phospho-L-lactate guanylyltransferase [Povalibacter sp.]|uniref:2-phospho-L-lactate guanylyltransferase n=1 Tax=Povalibacter sp. TaxID=1962978 RepID=UPI002F4296EF